MSAGWSVQINSHRL